LTGVRTGELRWTTPSQFDLTQGLWTIPSEVVKQLQRNKRAQDIPPYIVPLSTQAIEIVQQLLKRVRPAQKYLLAGRNNLRLQIGDKCCRSRKAILQNRRLHVVAMFMSLPLTFVCPECFWKTTVLPCCDSRPRVLPPPTSCPACHDLPLRYREATRKEVLKARLEEFLVLNKIERDIPCRPTEDNDCKSRSHL
jgi:hypothetical protein